MGDSQKYNYERLKIMILKKIKVRTPQENLLTNCYIVCDDETKETMVIDPGGEIDKVIEILNILNSDLKYILLTHCHSDHTNGLKELKEKKGGKILISRADAEGLYNPNLNLCEIINAQNTEIEADSRVDDSDLIHLGKLEFKIISTPGHTKGGICIYCEKERLIFTGDTLFSGSWGRTDLPSGSFEEIMESINEKLMTLPDETIIYPGHGKTTMIQDEKDIYINLKGKEF